MKLLSTIYKWVGSQYDFINNFSHNETLYMQAQGFWNNLDGCVSIVFFLSIVLGIVFAAYYYTIFNNQPGRHYMPIYWFVFLIISCVVIFIISMIVEYAMVTPKLDGALGLEAKVALCNLIYGAITYFITSVVWCNIGSTNAYRIFKF